MSTTNEGEFKKRLDKIEDIETATDVVDTVITVLNEAREEYPKVSQKWVPTKGRHVDWKMLCLQMEQKIIEFENFGKRWFGETKQK